MISENGSSSNSLPFSIRFQKLIVSADLVIDKGIIVVEDGKVKEIVPYDHDISNLPKLLDDFSDSIIYPGFINPHTHLELSFLKGKIRYNGVFTDWIESLVSIKRKTDSSIIKEKAKDAIKNLLKEGIVAIGDISSEKISFALLKDSPIKGTIFYELIGESFNQDEVDSYIRRYPETSNLKHGLSPHSIYSCSVDILKSARDFANQRSLPISIHLAETEDEIEYAMKGTGRFALMLSNLKGRKDSDFKGYNLDPVAFLDKIGFLKRSLLVHMNYPDYITLDTMKDNIFHITFSPGSNSWFKRKPDYPVEKYLELGIKLSLSTDSLASNETISMKKEGRALKKMVPSIRYNDIFKMMTENPAISLQNDNISGKLEKGKNFDAILIKHRNYEIRTDIFKFIIETDNDPDGLFINGNKIF